MFKGKNMIYVKKRRLSYTINLMFDNQIELLEKLYQSSDSFEESRLISSYKKHLRKLRNHFCESQGLNYYI